MRDPYHNYLIHHGILGMKWGKRKSVYKSSKESPGTQHEELKNKKPSPKEHNIKALSDDELRNRINRIELENRYATLHPTHISRGEKISKRILHNMVLPAAEDVGKQLIKSMIVKGVNKKLNLHEDIKVYTNNKKK